MIEDTKTVLLSLTAIIGLMAFLVVIGNNISGTGQAIHQGNMISASGTFTGSSGTGTISIQFPEDGGTASGTLEGRYAQGSVTSTYSGQISGTYYGGEGGTISGTMQGTGEVRMGGRIQRGPFTGQFNGIVSLTRGTVEGKWSGTQMNGQYTLTFTPRKGTAQTGTQQRVSTSGITSSLQPATVGYCRCIREGYSSGSEITPYGGAGLEFKGFMTMQGCINTCGINRYSWRER